MTDSEQHALIGATREKYRNSKKELAALRLKAEKLAGLANTLTAGLSSPEMIRWWDGRPLIGQRPEHIIFTSAMFAELTEERVKQLSEDIYKLEKSIAATRKSLIDLEGEDPEK